VRRFDNTGKYIDRREYRAANTERNRAEFRGKATEFRGGAANWVGSGSPVFGVRYWFN